MTSSESVKLRMLDWGTTAHNSFHRLCKLMRTFLMGSRFDRRIRNQQLTSLLVHGDGAFIETQ